MSYESEDFYNSDEFKTILRKFEQSEKTGQPAFLDSEELTDIGEYYYSTGNNRYANEIIDRAIEMYPGAASPLLFKARMTLLDSGDVDEAKLYMEQVDDKDCMEFHYVKVETMLAEGMAEEAEDYLEEIYMQADEDDKESFMLDASNLFSDYGFIDKAEKWLEKDEIKDDTEHIEALARLLFNKGEYKKCQNVTKGLIDRDPFSERYWNLLSSAQFCNDEITEALNSIEYAIAIDPKNAFALLNKANSLYQMENYKEALKYFKEYSKICPEDIKSEKMAGYCCIFLEQYRESVTHMKKAAKLAEGDNDELVEIYKNLALGLFYLGKVKEGMAFLDKTDTLECDHNEVLAYRGELLMHANKWHQAKACFIKALENSDFAPSILMQTAITLFEHRNIHGAYKIFKILYSRNKDWHEGYPYYTVCCHDIGDKKEFLRSLKLAIEYSPEETRSLLSTFFPTGMPVKGYYQYMADLLNDRKNNHSFEE